MSALPVFTEQEYKVAKILLAAKVASMMGRKLEEGDWSDVYCKAKNIPVQGWSNLNIDVNHNGLGIEFKILRVGQLHGRSIKNICGTTRMHPAATRSIRIENIELPPNEVMVDVLSQYSALIDQRTARVRANSPNGKAEMRIGWLLWEDSLREFLYFEENMIKPNPNNYYADWSGTPAKGIRKSSKSLWIFDKLTDKKRYSVTTSAGIKIQPYFDVPPLNDPNLIYFRVQSEPFDDNTIILWVGAATAEQLKERLGSIDREIVDKTIVEAAHNSHLHTSLQVEDLSAAVPLPVSKDAFNLLINNWEAVSDDHRIQMLIQSLKK